MTAEKEEEYSLERKVRSLIHSRSHQLTLQILPTQQKEVSIFADIATLYFFLSF